MIQSVKWMLPVALLVGVGCGRAEERAAVPQLVQEWVLEGGFASPESVVYDPIREVLYVSNVNGYEANGAGYLSRVSLDGVLLDTFWLAGLNAPTGMASWQDRLYVVDFDHLVVIDPATASIVARHPAPDARPGLNDVSVSPDGRVFVSGSFTQTIYALTPDGLMRWVQDPALRDANGLLADTSALIAVGYYWHRLAYASPVPVLGDTTVVDLESVEADGEGGYFLTTIGPRPIYRISASGERQVLLARDTFSADIEYLPAQRLLLVPSGGDRLFAFRLMT